MAVVIYKLNGKILKTSDNKILGYEKAAYEEKLADNTWAQIQQGLRDGNPMGWAVGDTKDLTLTNGDTYTIRLVDLQEGRYESTDGVKCKATFEFIPLLKGITRAMNSTQKTYGSVTSYTAGGWLNSDMRTYIKTSVESLIPEELSSVMLNNKVGSASYGGSGQTDTTAGGVIIYSDGDKLFLPAQTELDSTEYDYNTMYALYPEFDYYKTHDANNDRIKYQLGSTSANWYWNRSPYCGSSTAFCIIDFNGYASYYGANYTYAVALCFTL